MYHALLGFQLFLLQVNPGPGGWYKQDNPQDLLPILIVLGVIILFAVVFRFVRSGSSRTAGRTGLSGAPKKFSAFTLYRISSNYNLDKDQSKLLESIFRNDQVADPERIMKSPAALDRHFKRAYKTIEKNSETEEDVQQRLSRLFSLRNVIEAAPNPDSANSNQVAENTPAILGCGGDNYSVRILASKGLNVITEIPKNTLGTAVRLAKGANVTLSFFTKSSKGFSIEGQVSGIVNNEQGQGLQITHTGKVKPLVKRMYRRRQITIRCDFFHVFLDNSGGARKKAQKLTVDNKRFSGQIMDISVGGCSIKTSAPIQAGARLKITIDYDENFVINVLGQVIRTNRSGPAGTINHIKFLKVPRRAFNSISAMVFGYDDD